MTKQELNRDIKKLYQNVMQATYESIDFWQGKEPGFRREFHRLYHADKEFTCATVDSLKRMVWLNFKIGSINTFGYAVKI